MKGLIDNLTYLLTGYLPANVIEQPCLPVTAIAGGLSLVLGWDRFPLLPLDKYPYLVVEPSGETWAPGRFGYEVEMKLTMEIGYKVEGKSGILYGDRRGAGILETGTALRDWLRANEHLTVNGVPYTTGLVKYEETPTVGVTTENRKRIGERYSGIVVTYKRIVPV
jgi:hypothetical protein